MAGKDPFILEVAVAKIEQSQERILEHHQEFKNEFAAQREENKKVLKAISDEREARIKGDAQIRRDCEADMKKFYKNLAYSSFGLIVVIALGVIGFIAKKTL
jgi:transketolase